MSESPVLSQVLRSNGHEILQQGRTSFWACVWNQADDEQGWDPDIRERNPVVAQGAHASRRLEAPRLVQTPHLSGR